MNLINRCLPLLVLTGAAARADIPPPPGYVESCTIAKVQKQGEDCDSVRPYYAKRDLGEKTLGAKGYTFRCRTSGASVWTEIWCKAKDAKAEK